MSRTVVAVAVLVFTVGCGGSVARQDWVIQLFPGEASVKRGRGFSPATGDWEFFLLDVTSGETVITARGTTEISNIGGTCIGCHGGANAYDYACFSNDGCGALPFFISADVDPERDDARCK